MPVGHPFKVAITVLRSSAPSMPAVAAQFLMVNLKAPGTARLSVLLSCVTSDAPPRYLCEERREAGAGKSDKR